MSFPRRMLDGATSLRSPCEAMAQEAGIGPPPCLGCPLFEVCQRGDGGTYRLAAPREVASWVQNRTAMRRAASSRPDGEARDARGGPLPNDPSPAPFPRAPSAPPGTRRDGMGRATR